MVCSKVAAVDSGPSVAGLPRATHCAGDEGAVDVGGGLMGAWLAIELALALLLAVLLSLGGTERAPECKPPDVECEAAGGER